MLAVSPLRVKLSFSVSYVTWLNVTEENLSNFKKTRVVIFFSWVYVFILISQLLYIFFNITFFRNYKIAFYLECQAEIFTADPVVFSLLLGGMSSGPTGHSSY